METMKVSIALATYNGENYLEEQLRSIFSQTYSNIEVIACDDCSTDDTIKILEKYSKFENFKYFVNEKNIGYVKNFEKIISKCTGDFIALSDQDDIWIPEKIEILVKNIADNLCIHSDAYLVNADSELISNSYSRYSSKVTEPKRMYELAFNGCVTGCTALFKRELLVDLLPFPVMLDVHDRWIGALAFSKGRLKYLDQSLIKYRQHGGNNIGATNINSGTLQLIVKWFQGNRGKLVQKNQKFESTYKREHAFIKILLDYFPTSFESVEKNNLLGALRIYESFLNVKSSALISYLKYFFYFNVVALNAKFAVKILFYISILKEIFIRLFKKS